MKKYILSLLLVFAITVSVNGQFTDLPPRPSNVTPSFWQMITNSGAYRFDYFTYNGRFYLYIWKQAKLEYTVEDGILRLARTEMPLN